MMTDNEIIKALECCINGKCSECPLRAMACSEKVAMAFANDLINRQKAEIERLEKHTEMYHELRAEAVKEFAEKVKQKTLAMVFSPDVLSFEDYCECIDNLVKEMVGDTE